MNKWDKRFMEMASVIATWASCYQEGRKIGAVIVKDKRIMTTGYNGAPAGREDLRGTRRMPPAPSSTSRRARTMRSATRCTRSRTRFIQAARLGVSAFAGATLYCTHQPCVLCAKMIVNAGIDPRGVPAGVSGRVFGRDAQRRRRCYWKRYEEVDPDGK